MSRIEARKPKALGTLVRAGASTALAVASGGTSAAVTGTMTAVKAGKAVNGARALTRAVVKDRLALPAGPSAAGPAAVPPPSGRPGPSKPMPPRTRPTPSATSRPTRPPTSNQVITGRPSRAPLAGGSTEPASLPPVGQGRPRQPGDLGAQGPGPSARRTPLAAAIDERK